MLRTNIVYETSVAKFQSIVIFRTTHSITTKKEKKKKRRRKGIKEARDKTQNT